MPRRTSWHLSFDGPLLAEIERRRAENEPVTPAAVARMLGRTERGVRRALSRLGIAVERIRNTGRMRECVFLRCLEPQCRGLVRPGEEQAHLDGVHDLFCSPTAAEARFELAVETLFNEEDDDGRED